MIPYLILIRSRSPGGHKHFDNVIVTAFRGNVQWRGVCDLVPRRDDHVLVKLHQFVQD